MLTDPQRKDFEEPAGFDIGRSIDAAEFCEILEAARGKHS